MKITHDTTYEDVLFPQYCEHSRMELLLTIERLKQELYKSLTEIVNLKNSRMQFSVDELDQCLSNEEKNRLLN